MYKKSKINTLFIVFVILLIIVAVIKLIEYSSGDRTFKSDIASIDTSAVTIIKFYAKSENFKEVKLEKAGKAWKILYEKKTMSADKNTIKSLLSELSKMKVEQIAATDKSKWKDYQVDEKQGTRVKIEGKGDLLSDFIIGKFSYSRSPNPYMRQGSMATYVRFMNDDKVYAVSGYLSMAFNRGVNSFRNGQLTNLKKDNISKFSFIYPGDSSFVLVKNGKKWMINDGFADSAKAENYINRICRLYNENFIDDFVLSNLAKPYCTIRIEGSNFNLVEIKSYNIDPSHKSIITSTMNESEKFDGNKNNFFGTTFVGKSKLL